MRRTRTTLPMVWLAATALIGCSDDDGAAGAGAGATSSTTGTQTTVGGGASGTSGGGTGGAASTTTTTGAGGEAGPFSFLVYGDNRAGSDCTSNGVHLGLVAKMQAEDADFVVHLGDMMTGYAATTNWASDGDCTDPTAFGSFKKQIEPLQTHAPSPGLPTYFFPVIGNHDDGWGDGWYPDPSGDGVCSVFDPSALVPNHTAAPYFADKSVPALGDAEFQSALCATSSSEVYPAFFYYSFDHGNSHFVVLHVNNDYFDLLECNSCGPDQSDYDDYYNVHQLHWLVADLEKAKANPAIEHVFAFLHAPVFSSCDDHPPTTSAAVLSKTFSQYGVDVSFSGHNHVYERTVPIFVDDASPAGVEDAAKGTVYVTSGGAGSDLAGFNDAAWFDVTRESTYHYTKVTVDGSTVSVVVTDDRGAVIDQF